MDSSTYCVREMQFEFGVTSVDWAPNSNRLAVVSGFGVEVLEAEGERVWRWDGSGRPVGNVCWSPDGLQLASSVGNTLHLWKAQENTARMIWRASRDIVAIDWSPRGNHVACISGVGKHWNISIVDVVHGKEADRWASPSAALTCVGWSPDGSVLAVGLDAGDILLRCGHRSSRSERRRLRDLALFRWFSPTREIPALRGHAKAVSRLAWTTEGRRLASASGDKTVRIWNVAKRECVRVLAGHTGEVTAVCWSPDGTALASGSNDGSVQIWSLGEREESTRLTGHIGTTADIAFSPEGLLVASASLDKTVRIWRVPGASLKAYIRRQAASVGRRAHRTDPVLWVPERTTWKGRGHNANGVAILADNRTVILGSNDGSIRQVDLNTRVDVWKSKPCHESWINDITLSGDGTLFASCSNDWTVKVWAKQREGWNCITHFRGHEGPVRKASFSPGGEHVVSVSKDGTARIWNSRTGAPSSSESIDPALNHTAPGGPELWSADWHPRGRLIALGGARVHLRDAHDGSEVRGHALHGWTVRGVCWSPNGKLLASASSDKDVIVWDLANRQEVTRYQKHRGKVRCVCWSPDGRLIASGGRSTVRLWDPWTGHEVHRFVFQEAYAWRLTWASNGAFLAASLNGDVVRIWDTRELVPADPQPMQSGSAAGSTLPSELASLPHLLATLSGLGLAAPLAHLRVLLGLLKGARSDDDGLESLANHPTLRRFRALRWSASTFPGFIALLLKSVAYEGGWSPPADVTPTRLREALAEALRGEATDPQAPTLPIVALTQAADALDDRLFTLLELVGPAAVAADPSLPLRFLPRVSKLRALTVPQRRMLGLQLRFDHGGPSQGYKAGIEHAGIGLRGDLRRLLPSALALPEDVLRARYVRGDLLYRARHGEEPPRLRPTVLVLDVSPPNFGPVEATTRLAAHVIAASLLRVDVPVVLVTVGGEGSVHVLERPADLVDIWTCRSLEPADERLGLQAARAMREVLAGGRLEPIVVVLSHVFFGADVALPQVSSLRGLFVEFPGHKRRPAMAEVCQRWESVGPGEIGGLAERLRHLVG